MTSDCLFLCVRLNTVLLHLSYAFPFSSHSESCSSFLERTSVGLFKAMLEVKSQRQFQLLKPGLSFISPFSSCLCLLSSTEKGAEESDLLPAHVLEDIVCFPNVGNECSRISCQPLRTELVHIMIIFSLL